MQRRYDVHIDGKPLVIADALPLSQLPPQWLALRVDHPEEIPLAVERLLADNSLHGVHLFPGQVVDPWKAFSSNYVFVQAAGGVVVDEAGRLLVIHRLGRWDLPKGKVDAGETIEDAAVREVQEECGIGDLERVRHIAQTWHTYERHGRQHLKCTDWFLMRASSAQPLVPQSEEDIAEVRWMDPSAAELLKADTYPGLLPVIAAWEALGHTE